MIFAGLSYNALRVPDLVGVVAEVSSSPDPRFGSVLSGFGHEQARARQLSHDEPEVLQCCAEAARISADLAG